jgi:hypothetical protein
MIDTKRALEKNAERPDRSLVPKNWELVRRGRDGTLSVIAQNVLAYDLGPDGGVVFTNGLAIYYRESESPPTRLCEHDLVESVIVLA